MNLELPEHLREALNSLSSRTGRSANELAAEAVDRLLAEDTWFDAQVQLGIDQIARGEFLDEAAMQPRVARMMQG